MITNFNSINGLAAETHETVSDYTRSNASTGFLALVILLTSIVFITPLSDAWQRSVIEHYDNAGRADVAAREGSLERQLAFASLGIFGLAALIFSGGRGLRLSNTLAILCLAYLVWCFASCLWTNDLSMTSRRLAAFACELLAGIAIAQRISPRQFVWIVFFCTLSWLGLGCLAELTLNTFRPWVPAYRFAGIFHPNGMGINCALLIMSSVYLGRIDRQAAPYLYSIALVAVVFLVLTGSRTAVSSAVLLVSAWLFFTAPMPKRAAVLFCSGVVAACVLVGLGLGLLNLSSNIITTGRQDVEVSSLTGRLPLWDQLLREYVPQHPIAGFGYGAFWTPDRMEELTASQYWAVASTHSTYVDLLLHVGIVGALLCLSVIALAVVRAFWLERRVPGTGYGFLGMVVASGLTQGLFETTTGLTTFLSFFGICAVAILVLRDHEARSALPHRDSPRVLKVARSRQIGIAGA